MSQHNWERTTIISQSSAYLILSARKSYLLKVLKRPLILKFLIVICLSVCLFLCLSNQWLPLATLDLFDFRPIFEWPKLHYCAETNMVDFVLVIMFNVFFVFFEEKISPSGNFLPVSK